MGTDTAQGSPHKGFIPALPQNILPEQYCNDLGTFAKGRGETLLMVLGWGFLIILF